MRKKIFSALALGLILVGTASTVTSCKDYDEDIADLQGQITANSDAIKKLTELINSGSVITSVASAPGGVTVTMSDGKSFTLTNGTDGKDGVAGQNGTNGKDGIVWTIGDDGFWYKDNVKTDYRALGQDGKDGKDGKDGQDGKDGKDGVAAPAVPGVYYAPNATTGCFDKVTVAADGKETVEATTISFVAPGTITATMDGKNLSLFGVKGTSEPIVISLNGELTSLVFIPKLYLDGIETVEYPWVTDTLLQKKTTYASTNRQSKTVKGLVDYLANELPNQPAPAPSALKTYSYGPAWSVQYHMNPANAKVEYADVKGYNVLEPEVLYYNTRASKTALGVTSPEVNAAGKKVFFNNNGVLNAGLQIAHPELLEKNPTDWTVNENDNTIALQVNSKQGDAATVVTSDYALILPSRVYLEALIWNKAPMYRGDASSATGATGRLGDELGLYDSNKQVHVWDSPEEALQDPAGAALEVYYDDPNGITISDYLGIHYVKEVIKTRGTTLGTWAFGEEAEWGLKYEFNLVDYEVDGNVTHDSKYAKWVDQSKGQLQALNVKADGTTIDTQSATAVDREPLVQVLVKNLNGDVVLDGYILLHITQKPTVEEHANLEVDNYPTTEKKFNLCDAIKVFDTNWSEFSYYVLTDKLENMEKEVFDQQYEADVYGQIGNTAAGDPIYDLKIFKNYGDVNPENKATDLGDACYYPNTLGTTNHRFDWTLAEDELEALTHDKANLVEVTRYIRYKAIAGSKAKYDYIYVKMTVKLSRDKAATVAFGKKNDNYWFGLNGSDTEWEAVVLDVKEPTDNGDIISINRGIRSTLLGNQEDIAGTHKYYFVPKNTNVTALNGKAYTITAQSSAGDHDWNQVYCKYVVVPTADKHEYDPNTIDDLLDKCAVDYSKGAFENSKLYAVTGGVYTQIATLNQTTGEISLINNTACQDVLNAIGYEPYHANITKEMSTWVGVAAANGCGVSKHVTDGMFLASWQRPINLKEFDNQVAIDAKTNGNVIYVLDFLKLFDWRGETVGYMWGNQQWFWAYYNVKAISVDMNPAHITTNMHNGGSTFKPMNEITTQAELYAYPAMTKTLERYAFNLYPTYDKASQNAALINYMENNKELFGAIYYANNGDNVTEFDVRIPVIVEYEWGQFQQTVQIHINRTSGH